MVGLLPRSGWGYRVIQKLSATGPVSWLLARSLHHLDRLIMRLSGGRYTATRLLSGIPTVLLTTRGARTGKVRTVPLVAMQDDDKIILVASNFGRSHSPAWYYNLRAHPEAALTFNGRRSIYLAHEATGQERELYWRKAADLYAGFMGYARRAGARRIPIVVLTPMLGQATNAR